MNPVDHDIIKKVYSSVKIKEGPLVIEKLLLDIYFNPGVSTKTLARNSLLPLPLVSAIKKELIKEKVIIQGKGVECTDYGSEFVRKKMGYDGLDVELYRKLANSIYNLNDFNDILEELGSIFDNRPTVDVTLDQSRCTLETSLKRAVLCLNHNSLIGKTIVCIGDDDLVSVSLGILLKKLFPKKQNHTTNIIVTEIDKRIVEYIHHIAVKHELPITCLQLDLREPLPDSLVGNADAFFTDPPYTINGMTVFLSRGIETLKKEVGLPVFLSFAHKSPDETLMMQKKMNEIGLVVKRIFPRFNEYLGAEIIGNTSQMIVLETTGQTRPAFKGNYSERIYTGEINKTIRKYKCTKCGNIEKVGIGQEFQTIERLKSSGCPICKSNKFNLLEKKNDEKQ